MKLTAFKRAGRDIIMLIVLGEGGASADPPYKCDAPVNCTQCTIEVRYRNNTLEYIADGTKVSDVVVDPQTQVLWTTQDGDSFSIDFKKANHPFMPANNHHFSGATNGISGAKTVKPCGVPGTCCDYKYTAEWVKSGRHQRQDPKLIIRGGGGGQ
jgi:hypothetical protein